MRFPHTVKTARGPVVFRQVGPAIVNVDVRVRHDGGSIALLDLNDAARTWVEENVGGETSWLGRALAVEARYLDDLLAGMRADGLVVA